MALALDVGVSPRHMSFVETGRSKPSRDLVMRLASALQMPGREENTLLEGAGYARRHVASDFTDPDLAQVRRTLRFLLDRHEPNSALVFDRHWTIVMSNEAHRDTVRFLTDGRELPEELRDNLLRLTFHPDGLRPSIANWDVVGPALITRLERGSESSPSDSKLGELVNEMREYAPVRRARIGLHAGDQLLLPVHLRKGGVDLKLFSVLSTIGSAIDLTLQELVIETFFPANQSTEVQLAELRRRRS
jgi:transcriptional regulator with XRE-family HTH domain